jgi:hypothetical protein
MELHKHPQRKGRFPRFITSAVSQSAVAALFVLGEAASWAAGAVTTCTEAALRAAMEDGGEVTSPAIQHRLRRLPQLGRELAGLDTVSLSGPSKFNFDLTSPLPRSGFIACGR